MFTTHRAKRVASFLLICIVTTILGMGIKTTYARYSEKRMMITNIAIPVAIAAWRAHFEGTSMKRAIIQAACGGLIMQEGMKRATKLEERGSMYAWGTKLIVNLGASLCESAGYDKFSFRMDVGPVWIVQEDSKFKFKLGICSLISPIVHFAQGSKFDAKQSLKYGTFVFERRTNRFGQLIGTDALAYSTGNTFTTNKDGNHSGHEMVHTYQYRRNTIYPIQVSDFWPKFKTKYFKEDKWVDDTGWFINWQLQRGWANLNNKSTSFEIPLEEEAYYMERKYRH